MKKNNIKTSTSFESKKLISLASLEDILRRYIVRYSLDFRSSLDDKWQKIKEVKVYADFELNSKIYHVRTFKYEDFDLLAQSELGRLVRNGYLSFRHERYDEFLPKDLCDDEDSEESIAEMVKDMEMEREMEIEVELQDQAQREFDREHY